MYDDVPLRGRLLVATPPLVDPNFDRTVVLVLEHGEEGAIGVVLNRPSDVELADTLPIWKPHAAAPTVVFVGGPVQPDALIALARGGQSSRGWVSILEELGTIDLGELPSHGVPAPDIVRVFVGYAGWSPGQLESELDAGAWFVVDADPADPFVPEPDRLWRDVLQRQRGRVRIFALCPEDPSVN